MCLFLIALPSFVRVIYVTRLSSSCLNFATYPLLINLSTLIVNVLRVIPKDLAILLPVLLPLREIVHEALILNAYGIVLSHNHPSGDIKPSRTDIESTKNLIYMLNNLGIKLLDHLIIYNDTYYSMNDKKIIK